MKKIIIAIFAVAFVFTCMSVFANEDIYTVITNIDGTANTVCGAVNINDIDVSATKEYSIYMGDKVLMSTVVNGKAYKGLASLSSEQSQTKYISVEFTLDASQNTTCFLAGLTQENVEEVKAEVLKCALNDTQFNFENLDFIDTEKTSADTEDDDLCWAAAMSNVLWYTGWANKAGYTSVDDLFEYFISNFTDAGGSAAYGLPWFFDGSYVAPADWTGSTPTTASGAYFKEYDVHTFEDSNVLRNANTLYKLPQRLKEGHGITIGLEFYKFVESQREKRGAHAITMFGYVVDNDYDVYDTNYIKSLFVSDSDSHKYGYGDRRDAPNKYKILNVVPSTNLGYVCYELVDYSYSFDAGTYITEFLTLAPYSDSVQKEIGTGATYDRTNNSDIAIKGELYATDTGTYKTTFFETESVTLKVYLYGYGKVALNSNALLSVYVDGKAKYNNAEVGWKGSSNGVLSVKLGKLSQGEHTLQLAVQPKISTTEAYYNNNTYIMTFNVIGENTQPDPETEQAVVTLKADVYNSWESGTAVLNITTTKPLSNDVMMVASYTADGRLIGVNMYALNVESELENTGVEFDTSASRVEVIVMKNGSFSPYCVKAELKKPKS